MDRSEKVTAARALGQRGEWLAARHLVDGGMVLLDHNWSSPAGEIDLVLRDRDVLVVCEVKTRRSNDYGSPLEAVTPAKASRLRRLAAQWVAAHDLRPREIRIDLVGILARPGVDPVIEHVAGVC